MAVHPITVTIPLSSEMWEDTAVVRESYRRFFAPWAFADRNPMPTFVPFPAVERARQRVVEARARLSQAWSVLRHGVIHEEW